MKIGKFNFGLSTAGTVELIWKIIWKITHSKQSNLPEVSKPKHLIENEIEFSCVCSENKFKFVFDCTNCFEKSSQYLHYFQIFYCPILFF